MIDMLLNTLYTLFIIAVFAMFLGFPVLYFVDIYKKKHIIQAELISWTINKYSSDISGNIEITNLTSPTLFIKKIYVRPSTNTTAFSKIKYSGRIEPNQNTVSFPITLSMLDKKSVSVVFPIDISGYYEFMSNPSNRPWTLILKTNRLGRKYRISTPVVYD